MRDNLVRLYYAVIEKTLAPLAGSSLSPNAVSLASVALSMAACLFYAGGGFFMGGIMLLVSGITDTLDGTIARLSGRSTRFGALLDSSLDRWADFIVFSGLIVYFRDHSVFFGLLFLMAGSFMVSYVKARAESLGEIRVVGFMQRPERVLFLAAASLIEPLVGAFRPEYSEMPVIAVLWFMAVCTNLTAIHRLLAARRDLNDGSHD